MKPPDYERENVKLYLGNALELLPELEGVDCVLADPPYGVSHVPGAGRMSKVTGGIKGDLVPPDVSMWAKYPAIIWGGNNFCDQLPRSTGWLIWDKTHAETCEHSQAELAWTNTVKTIRWHREAYHGFMRGRDGWFHQHQKPVKLLQWCLEVSKIALTATVLDPYTGSGSGVIACIRRGNPAIGIELDPAHFETARARIDRELDQPQLPGLTPEPQLEQPELLETANPGKGRPNRVFAPN